MSVSERRAWGVAMGGAIALVAQPALAHPGHLTSGFEAGWVHPFSGLDHLLAMVAVGLLAVRLGGAALWQLPAAFMAGMLAGGGAAIAGISCPPLEAGVVASVLALGLFVAAGRVMKLATAAVLVGPFAAFHGYAHAAEMAGSPLATYAAGFLLATALLHISGIAAGLILARTFHMSAVRAAGGAIAAAGLLLCWGLLG